MRRLVTTIALTVVLLPTALRGAELPTEMGQSAFAALAEVADRLTSDPETDWSRVDLLALREHLVDMSEVLLQARVDEEPLVNGVAIRVSGEGRTLEALRRMIPMHSRMLQGQGGWQVEVREHPTGFEIDLTSVDAQEVPRLRGLGFFGFLAAGKHHRMHHMGLATGSMHHGHHGSP